jgi:hypothetical protein
LPRTSVRAQSWCNELGTSIAIGASMNPLRIALFTLILGVASMAQGQQATERFVPLGQSPGMSGKTTLIGSIGAVDSRNASLAVQSGAGSQPVKVTKTTRIWLDRSAARQSTQVATMADLRPGQRIEVKFTDAANRTTADWIKIDAGTPP